MVDKRSPPPRPIRVEGDIAYVPLTRGYVAIIDAADAPLVAGRNWHACTTPTGHVYAVTTKSKDNRRSLILMHRVLTNALPGEDVDHKDSDGLNNRRKNLRPCSHQQNVANQSVSRRNLTGLKGAFTDSRRGGFRARIQVGNRRIELGSFKTPEEAAAAYRGAAIVLHGSFAQGA